ncbi:MAG TPA: hypothetical protein VK586_16925 [Streptosporangiaceae bacterium]|nr:hypothetical protein [Streptosporangiaceae bacterium]
MPARIREPPFRAAAGSGAGGVIAAQITSVWGGVLFCGRSAPDPRVGGTVPSTRVVI